MRRKKRMNWMKILYGKSPFTDGVKKECGNEGKEKSKKAKAEWKNA
jgi:hypothetical protein